MAAGTVQRLLNHRGPLATQVEAGDRSWYRFGGVKNVRNVKTDKTVTQGEVWIYDEIGFWGVGAADFARELADYDVESLTVRLNSPGGEVYDGIAIMNALIDHKAEVTVKIDALAASIASVIAMAGDKVVMSAHSEMMIHDASTYAGGNAEDFRQMADFLDRVSNNIAEVYTAKAGGKVSEWRDRMLAETWMSPAEAVALGLADEALPSKVGKDNSGEEGDGEEDASAPTSTDRWAQALAGTKYKCRAQAPDPYVEVPPPPPVPPVEMPVEPPAPAPDPGEGGGSATPDPEEPDFEALLGGALSEMTNSLQDAVDDFEGVDPEVFREAVALVTNADVPVQRPAPVRAATPPAFPADSPGAEPNEETVDPALAGLDPDVFAAALAMVANDAPAIPQPAPTEPAPTDPDSFGIDPDEFYNSLKEAIFK